MSEELYDILVLEHDTKIGQRILAKLESINPRFFIFVQTKKNLTKPYKNQIFIDLNDEKSIREAFLKFKVVIYCSTIVPKKVLEVSKQIQETDFLSVNDSDSSCIIEALKLKFPTHLTNVIAYEEVKAFDGFHHFRNTKLISKPKTFNNKSVIECAPTDDSRYFLLFSSKFQSFLFYFFLILAKIIPFFSNSKSNLWFFSGTNDEGKTVECNALITDLEGIKIDLITHTVIKTLMYKGWFDFFEGMTIRML